MEEKEARGGRRGRRSARSSPRKDSLEESGRAGVEKRTFNSKKVPSFPDARKSGLIMAAKWP